MTSIDMEMSATIKRQEVEIGRLMRVCEMLERCVATQEARAEMLTRRLERENPTGLFF